MVQHADIDHTGVTGVAGAVFVGCVAARTTDQTGVVTATDTAVLFTGTDELDTHAFHDPASNSDRITIPSGKAGKYRFWAMVGFDSNSTGYRQLTIRKNAGGTIYAISRQPAVATGETWMEIGTGPVDMAVGDYMRVVVLHTAGANRTIPGATVTARFGATFLGT